jgi:DNA-binding response OmpR family regulator
MKKKIIISDDDEAIVTVLTMMLEDAGYEVRSIANGNTVQMVGDYLPDLLLLDIWMTGIDGRDVCKYLKSQKRTKHIPVIMISANQNTEKIASEAGANDFITKPFDMDEMLEKIARYT